MLRCAISALRTAPLRTAPLRVSYQNASKIIYHDVKNFTCLSVRNYAPLVFPLLKENLTNNKHILDLSYNLWPAQIRTVTKFSLKKGKRKTVKAAVKRFFRLHWGGWIRTKVGRHKKLWKKSPPQRRRLRQHVFCNSTQSTLLDKMVTKYWKKPKYYVEDPYAPYHTREEFYITRKKPLPKT